MDSNAFALARVWSIRSIRSITHAGERDGTAVNASLEHALRVNDTDTLQLAEPGVEPRLV
jgi:hypothetical protein